MTSPGKTGTTSPNDTRSQFRAIKRAVAFAQSGKAGHPEHRREEDAVSNAVYRAFGQPLVGDDTTTEHNQVRLRLMGAVTRLSGVELPVLEGCE